MKTTYSIHLKTQGFAFASEFVLWGALSILTGGLLGGVLAWRMVYRITEALEFVRNDHEEGKFETRKL